MLHTLRVFPLFSLVVLVTLGFLGYIGLMLFGGLLGVSPAIAAMGHFSSLSHRVHELTYSFLFGVAAVGMTAQLRAPSNNVAGQLMALIPWVGFVLAFALGNILVVLFRPPFVPIFGALTLIAIVLHPAGRDLLSSFSVSRLNRVMLALVVIAAVPLLAFAAERIGFQRTIADDHAAQGHYGYMAAFSFTVIAVGLLASLRLNGWWLAAWVAGLLPVLLGIASLVYPDVASSLDLVWALAAIAWGVVFVAAAELIRRASPVLYTGDDTGVGPQREPSTGTPRWVHVFGLIALVPILLVVINMMTVRSPTLVVVLVVTHRPYNTDHRTRRTAGAPAPQSGYHCRGMPPILWFTTARLHTLTALLLAAACAAGSLPGEAIPVKEKYSQYTVGQAEREGFKRDPFCLDAATFGQPASQGAMGFHATDETRLRGPIQVDRPQAIMFDSDGRVLGVEYEVTTDAVPQAPQLFGKTFAKLPPHAGVAHEHYALHVWFVENPSGAFADFNPKVSCPTGSTPSGEAGPAHGGGH